MARRVLAVRRRADRDQLAVLAIRLGRRATVERTAALPGHRFHRREQRGHPAQTAVATDRSRSRGVDAVVTVHRTIYARTLYSCRFNLARTFCTHYTTLCT